jgi:hypothetical protein
VEEEHGQAIGMRIDFKTAKWPENLKASRAGKLMMWGVGWSAGQPDGATFLAWATAPTRARPTTRASTCRPSTRCTSAARAARRPRARGVMTQAKKLMVAYMPYKVHVHRIATDLAQPWVQGYQPQHLRARVLASTSTSTRPSCARAPRAMPPAP